MWQRFVYLILPTIINFVFRSINCQCDPIWCSGWERRRYIIVQPISCLWKGFRTFDNVLIIPVQSMTLSNAILFHFELNLYFVSIKVTVLLRRIYGQKVWEGSLLICTMLKWWIVHEYGVEWFNYIPLRMPGRVDGCALRYFRRRRRLRIQPLRQRNMHRTYWWSDRRTKVPMFLPAW